jgi:hypothetical protein
VEECGGWTLMLTIVWDVDDVLNDLMRVWLETAWLAAHRECHVRYEGLHENPPHRLIGASVGEYLASLDEFRRKGMEILQPLGEAEAWFKAHGARYRHLALTAVPLCCAPLSAAWVVRHFGRWIRDFHFVPSARTGESLPTYEGSKLDFLKWWGKGDVLVDDGREITEAAGTLGMKALLMPRPWNHGQGTVAGVFQQLEKL